MNQKPGITSKLYQAFDGYYTLKNSNYWLTL